MKRLKTLLLFILILLVCFENGIVAAESLSDYVISNGVLTAYKGAGGEITIPDSVVTVGINAFANCTTITKVTIPESVHEIAWHAFEGCSNLETVVIPQTLPLIGRYVFKDCTSLKNINIPNVEYIDLYAFSGCTSLESVVIPNTVVDILDYAFENCTSLINVTIPNTVKRIAYGAFMNCTSLEEISIPESVKSIGTFGYGISRNGTFSGCTSLKKITIPKNVTSISETAFENCPNLTIIGDEDSYAKEYADSHGIPFISESGKPISVTGVKIDQSSFTMTIGGNTEKLTAVISPSNATNQKVTWSSSEPTVAKVENGVVTALKEGTAVITVTTEDGGFTDTCEVTVSKPVSGIDITTGLAFSINGSEATITGPGNHPLGGSLVIPDEVSDGTAVYPVTSIGVRAFYDCGFTGDLIIPDSVTSIESYAFSYCDFTGDLTIPDSVTSIGNSAFFYCGFTGNLTIGNSVTSIGEGAFRSCDFTGDLTIPDSVTSIERYAFCDSGFTGDLTIGNSVTSIVRSAFNGCGFTGDLTIPDSVTSIETDAFSYCGFTGDLIIPDSVTSIGRYAFYNSGFTGDLTIGNSVTSIGDDTFYGCGFTGDLTIGNSVTSIGDKAFYGYGFTGNLTIGNSVTSIGDEAFYDCDFTGNLTIPDSVTSIGDSAFYNLAAFYDRTGFTGDLMIPDSVTSIGDYAFYNRGFTGDLIIGNSVTSIGNWAFRDCDFTGNLTIGNSVTFIGDYAFTYCGFTGNLTIPDSVTYIGNSAFAFCGFTGNLTIGNSVTSIGDSAFYDCGFTGNLTIPDSVTSIGNFAFSDCTDFIGDLIIPDSVISIGDFAFSFTGFTKIIIPDIANIFDNNMPYHITLSLGDSRTLHVALGTDDASNLIWSSKNPSTVSVDSNGYIQALKEGFTTITVKTVDGREIAHCLVTVNNKISVSVKTNLQTDGEKGAPVNLNSTMVNLDLSVKQNGVTYRADTLQIDTIELSGLKETSLNFNFPSGTPRFIQGAEVSLLCSFPGLGDKRFNKIYQLNGAADIDENGVISITLDITKKAIVEEITISGLNTISVGKSTALKTEIKPATAVNKSIIWSSSDSSIAKVNASGTVTGVSLGRTTITATAKDGGGAFGTWEIEVIQPVTKITVFGNTNLTVGETKTFTANILPANASFQDVTWSSSSAKIASVDSETGVVTGLAKGSATITAAAKDGSKVKGTFKVNVIQQVEQISLSGAETVSVGKSVSLKAAVLPAAASNKNLEWTSSDPSISKVSASGTITGVSLGRVTITATAKDGGGAFGTLEIEVIQPVTKITVSGNTTLTVGENKTLTANILPANASIQDVTWSSSNAKIASVDPETGAVTGLAKGFATITAAANDGSKVKGTFKVNVIQQVEQISLSGIGTVSVGKNVSLKADILPAAASNKKVEWTSSDSSIAKVNASGMVTGVSLGRATITATAKDGGGAFGTWEIEVIQPVTKITVFGNTNLTVGETKTFTANILPANASLQEVSWSSSDKKVAFVDPETGVITGLAKGSATIIATAKDGSKVKGTFKVNVIQPVEQIFFSLLDTVNVGKSEKIFTDVLPYTASNKNVEWISSDPSIAKVNASGLITGVSLGRVTIKATAKDGYGAFAAREIEVIQPVTKITVSGNANLAIGENETLTANILPENAFLQEVSWSSSNTKVASVDPETGVVVGLAKGSTVINATAKDGSKIKGTFKLSVVPGSNPVTVQSSKSSLSQPLGIQSSVTNQNDGNGLTLGDGKEKTLNPGEVANLSIFEDTGQQIIFGSRDENIILVDAVTGKATAVNPGQTALYALSVAPAELLVSENVAVIDPRAVNASVIEKDTEPSVEISETEVSETPVPTEESPSEIEIPETETADEQEQQSETEEELPTAPSVFEFTQHSVTLRIGETFNVAADEMKSGDILFTIVSNREDGKEIAELQNGVLTAKHSGSGSIIATDALNGNDLGRLEIEVVKPAVSTNYAENTLYTEVGQQLLIPWEAFVITPEGAYAAENLEFETSDAAIVDLEVLKRSETEKQENTLNGGSNPEGLFLKFNNAGEAAITVTVPDENVEYVLRVVVENQPEPVETEEAVVETETPQLDKELPQEEIPADEIIENAPQEPVEEAFVTEQTEISETQEFVEEIPPQGEPVVEAVLPAEENTPTGEVYSENEVVSE